MALLLICSVVALAITILRGLALQKKFVMPDHIIRSMDAVLPGDPDTIAQLAKAVRADASPLSQIVLVAVQHLHWPKGENLETVQTKARNEISRLETGIFVLEIIVGIAPLLGLLGAVSGLVTVFASFSTNAQAANDPSAMARGISEALSTTIVGLAIAIPTLIAHITFSRRVETFATDLEIMVSDLLAKCYGQRRLAARFSPAAAGLDSTTAES